MTGEQSTFIPGFFILTRKDLLGLQYICSWLNYYYHVFLVFYELVMAFISCEAREKPYRCVGDWVKSLPLTVIFLFLFFWCTEVSIWH